MYNPEKNAMYTNDTAEENEIAILNTPDADKLWEAIGGHHDTMSQILYEFIDNSLSSIIGSELEKGNIDIEITDCGDKKCILLQDTGTGIEDLNAAFTLGCKDGQKTPLNEHGIGLKHALSSANPGNDSWTIYTRTAEDLAKGVYKQISAKYSFDGFRAKVVVNEKWLGLYNQPGSIIKFYCSNDLFLTIGKGRQGRIKLFDKLIEALIEDIGYTYAGIIKDGKVIITVSSRDGNGKVNTTCVKEIEPVFEETYELGGKIEEFDLGSGPVKLEYCFGRINDKSSGKYYKRKMSSAGCEIRVNGRILANGLFREIWDTEMHPSYNGLHVSVNIISSKLEALPKTRTSKNGFREGDKRLIKLYEEIRRKMPDPMKDEKPGNGELGWFAALAERKKTHMLNDPVIDEGRHAFVSLGGASVKMDLYITSVPNNVIIYEGKRIKSKPKDVYQLMMYWDGLVYDGIQPTEGILLACEHPESVYRLIEYMHDRFDANGTNYSFKARTWEDEGMGHLLESGAHLLL